MVSTDNLVSLPQYIGETKPPLYVHGSSQKSQQVRTPPFFNYHTEHNLSNVPWTKREKYLAPYSMKYESSYIQNHMFTVLPTRPINHIYKLFSDLLSADLEMVTQQTFIPLEQFIFHSASKRKKITSKKHSTFNLFLEVAGKLIGKPLQ